MKNVNLQIVQHMKPGGIETLTLDLQQYMTDFDVHIVSLEGTKDELLKNWPRLRSVQDRLHCLEKKPGLQISTLFKLMTLMKRLEVKAVHTHHIGPLTYGGIAARICKIQSLVHTEHDAWHLESPKAAALEKKLIRFLKPSIVADCQSVADKLTSIIPAALPSVIYNGIDTVKFAPASPLEKMAARKLFHIDKTAFVIGCAARMEKVKGLSYLISALTYLKKDVKLVLAGDGSERAALEKYAKDMGLEARVTFLGRIEQMDLFYKSLDVFCLPSLNEGFPLSPLEAQACNVPAVVTDVGGAKEALCQKTGDLVPAKSSASLVRAFDKLIKSSTHSLSFAPRDFVLANADMRLMVQAYSTLLKK